jgi:hypothetical protein
MAKKLKFKCLNDDCRGGHLEQQITGAITVCEVEEDMADGELAYGKPVIIEIEDGGYQYMCSECGRVYAESEEGLMEVAEEEGWLVGK